MTRPGHADRKVVKDGRYGTPRRQRFRCAGPDGFHRFVPDLSRQVADAGICDTCDSHVPSHPGPVTGRKNAFPVREVDFVLRSARRTTMMLELVRLHLNGAEHTRRYTTVLRGWLDDQHGVAHLRSEPATTPGPGYTLQPTSGSQGSLRR